MKLQLTTDEGQVLWERSFPAGFAEMMTPETRKVLFNSMIRAANKARRQGAT